MQGFGRYSALHQAHARANAEKAAQERKDASREVTDRRQESKDRGPPKAATERAADRSVAQEAAGLRPSRPMSADAWSLLLPNGPAPGESEGTYIWRRHGLEQDVRSERIARTKDENVMLRIIRTETDPVRRNEKIQAIIDRQGAQAEARKAQGPKHKDADKGVEIGDE